MHWPWNTSLIGLWWGLGRQVRGAQHWTWQVLGGREGVIVSGARRWQAQPHLPPVVPQKHLAGLGLTEAIDKNKADLSRMSGKKDLYLASVFHATAFEWDTDGNPFDQDIYGREELRTPKLFYADHPFIFLVRDTQSGSLLFIGRLVRPKGDKMRDEL